MLKLLIVDDDANNRAVMQDALECNEYELIEACDGYEALEVLKRTTPDLILLDVLMPGIDGIATLRRIHANEDWAHIPVIMVTAMNMDSQIAACLDEGAIDHVTKPFSGLVLRARVRAALRMGAQQGSPTSQQPTFANRRGRVVTFIGAKGGVGTTTIALNMAASLASDGTTVTVAELRTDYGTLGKQLAISPVDHLGGLAAEEPEDLTVERIGRCVIKHSSGIRVLLGPQAFDSDMALNDDQATAIVNRLADSAEVMLTDVPYRGDLATRSIIRQSDLTVVVTEIDDAALDSATKLIAWLETLGVKGHNLAALVNHRSPAAGQGVSVMELQERIPCELLGIVPHDQESCRMALRNGIPITATGNDGLMANSIRSLAKQLLPNHTPGAIQTV